MRGRWRQTRAGVGLVLAAIGASSGCDRQQADAPDPLVYPPAPRSDAVDEYHGRTVPDPFAPLDRPDRDPARTWLRRQRSLTSSYLDATAQRAALRRRIRELWPVGAWRSPHVAGGRLFVTRAEERPERPSLVVVGDGDQAPRTVVNGDTLPAGQQLAEGGYCVSPRGSYVAYGSAVAGSHRSVWRVRPVADGGEASDRLERDAYGPVAWLPSEEGFFYTRYQPRAELADATRWSQQLPRVYLHRLGHAQSADQLVYVPPDHPHSGNVAVSVSGDGRWLTVLVRRGLDSERAVLYRKLDVTDASFQQLFGADAWYELIGQRDSRSWFVTTLDAPRGRIVQIDRRAAVPHTVIAESDDVIDVARVVGDRIAVSYLHDAHSRVRVFQLDGEPDHRVRLPDFGRVDSLDPGMHDDELLLGFSSFTVPPTLLRHDLASRRTERLQPERRSADGGGDFVTDQVFYRSSDGVVVPMFLSRARSARLEPGAALPVLLYGYGAFGYSQTPTYAAANVAWLERGGVLAVACVRGGGEYGHAWHQAARGVNKQRSFDDFIAAAEWLVRQGWTRSERLAIHGFSAGGLLVAAALTQRPRLFGAALPARGVYDMLRLETTGYESVWTDEFGRASDPDQFDALLSYSPLHRVEPGTCYPASLITTGGEDEVVAPSHSYKFAAALQAAQSCPQPILLRVDPDVDHDFRSPELAADRLAFLVRVFGL